jgi:predicted RNA-binding Zn ribbon-like protein
MIATAEYEFGKRVGGRLCLDFINTVQGREPGPGGVATVIGERLVSYDALVRWATLADALTPAEGDSLRHAAAARPAEAAETLARCRAVRDAMCRIFASVVEGRAPVPADVAALNDELRRARAREHLEAAPVWRWRWDDDAGALERMLWPVVASAAELLTEGDLARVRQCPGSACGWLFYDSSRSGRRQWCDMADCGNVAKVRRFRQRHRAG